MAGTIRNERHAYGSDGVQRPMTGYPMVGYLPCVRRGSLRWWLPLSADASDVLGHAILDEGQSTADPSRHHPLDQNRAHQQRLYRQLRVDPPLLLYAALQASYPCEHSFDAEQVSRTEERSSQTLDGLADWWFRSATRHFADGDAFLGAPPVDPISMQRWQELETYFRSLPVDRWLENAHLYLEVLGPDVPESIQVQWPRLVVDPDRGEDINGRLDPPTKPRTPLLQNLARASQASRTLHRSFDHRLRTSKLAAIKQLAYGLSHEINNPLANISTRAEQLQRTEVDPARKKTLQRIIDQVYRSHEMIADLMFYAHPPTPDRQTMIVADAVRTVAEETKPVAEEFAIKLALQSDLPDVSLHADGKMITEAIRVLIRNAIEAIGTNGTVVLSMDADESQVQLHVADSGPGLSEEAREHAFDPYFSGREAGRGLGLGLCRAYRIARLHHGEIRLTSAPAGCVATLSLPKA
ncbi:MAG: HAMP domain-containing sensor histidine kinase [Planctomycetota bacterium]